jgi:putative ABC transport system substrate-binding protein
MGWVEGKNLVFEHRYSEGKLERLPALVDELVRLKLDVIFTGSTPAARAAKNTTTIIPIVFLTPGDPVVAGTGPNNLNPRIESGAGGFKKLTHKVLCGCET